MKYFILTLFACLLACSAVKADQERVTHWLVGSYPEKDQAIRVGERLSGATGVELLMLPVEVDGKPIYQLFVHLFTDEYDQARLKSQLGYAGVTDIRESNITGSEPGLQSLFAVLDYSGDVLGSTSTLEYTLAAIPDAVTADVVKQNFMVMGSFRDGEHARLLQHRLSEAFNRVTVKVASVNGVAYHRVLVGPVNESTEEEYRARASAAGTANAWILRGVTVEMTALTEPTPNENPDFRESVDESITSIARSSDQAVDKATEKLDSNSDADAFNLARLKKSSVPFFLRQEK